MKHLLTILIMAGCIVALIGIFFLIDQAIAHMREFVWRRPKLERVLDKVGMIIFAVFFGGLLVTCVVVVYTEIYKLL